MTEENGEGGKLVSIFKAKNELEAITIQSFLESQGINAAVRSRQIPMYDGIAKVWNPVWGNVLVMEKDSGIAAELISEYLDSCSEDAGFDEDDFPEGDIDK
mgnify:CR=1 FL=1